MIQELTIKNHLSFKDETVISFEATNDNILENQVVEIKPGVRLLRLALIIGPNASGKSNLLKALENLKTFWLHATKDIDEETVFTPFLLDKETPHQPSEFELIFYVNQMKYKYSLSADKHKVYNEKLFCYRTNQPTKLFERTLEDNQSVIKFNQAVLSVDSIVTKEISLKCLPNMSFFAARNQVNCNLKYIDEAINWMKNNILPLVSPKRSMTGYGDIKLYEEEKFKEYLLNFIQKADLNITNIKVETEEEDISPTLVNKTSYEHTVTNERGTEKYDLPDSMQSDGTKRTVGLEAELFDAIEKNAILPIDEIESSLHPELVEFVLRNFLTTNSNSQLIISSHYIPLLNTINDFIRKDSVWFVEKKQDGGSDLYSLVEFKGLNKVTSFIKSYKRGNFGAYPEIDR